jgi:hypothetical protein
MTLTHNTTAAAQGNPFVAAAVIPLASSALNAIIVACNNLQAVSFRLQSYGSWLLLAAAWCFPTKPPPTSSQGASDARSPGEC